MVVLGVLVPPPLHAQQVTVAVAANFLKPLQTLKPLFERSSNCRLLISSASTGQLYAQITKGAPFEVFLAADERRPRLLEAGGAGVAGTRFTYAVGRLALWSPARKVTNGPAVLKRNDFRTLAIANPRLAPYGVAAQQTLMNLRLWDRLNKKIVMGENIAQTFAMVRTGNADLGFVALSQIRNPNADITGTYWLVPAQMHAPIRQQAILLRHGYKRPPAIAFLKFLRSKKARSIIIRFGYGLEGNE